MKVSNKVPNPLTALRELLADVHRLEKLLASPDLARHRGQIRYLIGELREGRVHRDDVPVRYAQARDDLHRTLNTGTVRLHEPQRHGGGSGRAIGRAMPPVPNRPVPS
jgi:N-acetyl-beta-hexosaminidase